MMGAPSSVNDFVAPYYGAPVSPGPVAHTSKSLYQTASLRKRLFQKKFVWLAVIWLLSLIAVAGIGIGARESRSRRFRNAEMVRRSNIDDIQNSLGFKPGQISDAGYSGEIKGIFVESLVTDDGPAAVAGIEAGDILLELEGVPVRGNSDVSQILKDLSPNSVVQAKVYREGETLDLKVNIADRNFQPLQPKFRPREQGWIGIRDSVRRCCVPGTQQWGLEVLGTMENSPADLGGLREGDVITEFNGSKIRTPEEFNRRVRNTKPRSKATITFYRGNVEQKAELILGYRQ